MGSRIRRSFREMEGGIVGIGRKSGIFKSVKNVNFGTCRAC